MGLAVGLGRRVCWGRLRWGSRARRRCLRAAGRRTCCAGVRARLGSAARERAVRGERLGEREWEKEKRGREDRGRRRRLGKIPGRARV
jgi:hypothetical protein